MLSLLLGCHPKASDEIGFGEYSDGVYSNDYLGFNISLPSDWNIQNSEQRTELIKKGAEVVADDDSNLKRIVKTSELQTVNLFSVFKFLQGAPVNFNPSIIAVAENVKAFPGIKRGSDYLFIRKHFCNQVR
jgi:hypothetical protein